ncbi:MAG: hypothetical protein ABI703_03620 [Gemmatimonadales bacterium]
MSEASADRTGGRRILALVVLIVVLGLGGWAYLRVRSANRTLERTQSALKLQVLTGRLGIAALEAEYGNYENARGVVSGVFDGIRNYGIEHGSLPENYATVLSTRDHIITALARAEPGVREELTTLFFRLQIPVDTKLDPRYIIPAADSGVGLEPPRRVAPTTDSTSPRPDTLSGGGDSVRVPRDRTNR